MIPSRSFLNTPDQDNDNSTLLEITWANGNSNSLTTAEEYPVIAALQRISGLFHPLRSCLKGSTGLFSHCRRGAKTCDEGIFFDIQEEDFPCCLHAHKLVCLHPGTTFKSGTSPHLYFKKPASILKNILSRAEQDVTIKFDSKNAYFQFESFILVCRLVEGNYPAYKSVIPKNNQNKLLINRLDFLNSTRRIAVCSNQASSQVKLKLSYNQLVISAQDNDF